MLGIISVPRMTSSLIVRAYLEAFAIVCLGQVTLDLLCLPEAFLSKFKLLE
jgi:hypothetical protein